MLNNIRIVLVQTTHPGNIGSTARAMKTMGLSQLVLVEPKIFPHAKAIELAAGADDILTNAKVVSTLEHALIGCRLVIGTSARCREIPLALLTPRQAAAEVATIAIDAQVALVFGQEKAGLTNDELGLCQLHMMIPADPSYSSLNLAMAVQILCYECRMASLAHAEFVQPQSDTYATADDIERFYQHLQTVLTDIHFLRPRSPKRLMPRLRRLFNRLRLETMEVNMLRGILSAIEYQMLKVPTVPRTK